MSIQIDINSLGDLIHSHGTEADRRSWARIRAHLDRQGELLKLSDSEQCRRLQSELDAERLKWQGHPVREERPAAIVLWSEDHSGPKRMEAFESADEAYLWSQSSGGYLVPIRSVAWHPAGDKPPATPCRTSCARAEQREGGS